MELSCTCTEERRVKAEAIEKRKQHLTREGSERLGERGRKKMALFGDEDGVVGEVGPFVMAEGGEEEWFPFTLDNLEMDRACSSLQEDSRPMDQVCACCRPLQKKCVSRRER